jgi:hypothetical protein
MTTAMVTFLIGILAAAVLLYAVVASGAGTKRGKKRPRSSRGYGSSHGYRGFVDPAETRARWDNIKAVSKTGASGLKSSINEADKLFDYVMKSLGFPGDTMGDRLKSARTKFANYSTYDAVWRAHKLRNSLAHELSFDLVPSQAHEALADFERGLRELGAL